MSKQLIILFIVSLVCLYMDVAFSQSFIFSALSLSSICVISVSNLLFFRKPNLVFGYVAIFSTVYGLSLQQNLANLLLSWSITLGLIYVFNQVLNFTSHAWWWSLGFLNVLAILLILQGTQWSIVQYALFVILNMGGVKLVNWVLSRFGEQQHLRYDW